MFGQFVLPLIVTACKQWDFQPHVVAMEIG